MPLLGGLVDAADQHVSRKGGDDRDNAQPDGRAPLVHGRGLLLIFLGLEEVGVSAKLEDEVSQVSQEEEDGSAARQSEEAGKGRVVRGSRVAVACEPTASLVGEMICDQSEADCPLLTSGRDDEGDTGQAHERHTGLGGCHLEGRLMEVEPRGKEAHSKNQQKIGKYAAQKGSLDKAQLVLGQGDDGDDELHSVSEPASHVSDRTILR